MYLAIQDQSLVQIKTISEAYNVSENHLVKVVQHLVRLGYVASVRGRSGGIRLAQDPEKIRLGEVFRETEPNLKLLTCFDEEHNSCPIMGICDLQGVFQNALKGFLAELDKQTLADVIKRKKQLMTTLRIPTNPPTKQSLV